MVWQTVDRGRGHRVLIATILIPVKSRIAAQERPLEARQRLLDDREVYRSRPKRLGKLGLICRVVTNLRNGNIVSLIHLQRVDHGKRRLRLQAGSAAIPELERIERCIQKGRGIAFARQSADALCNRSAIREADIWVMARSAGYRVAFRQPRVVEEFSPQRDRFRGWRVVGRNRNWRQPERSFDGDNLTKGFFTRRGPTSNAKGQASSEQNGM
jgi:hypothetical protein